MTTLELEARLGNLLSTAQEETADIDLFAAIPEREECPVCMMPHPLLEGETIFVPCCGKHICLGCIHKRALVEMKKGIPTHKHKCAFCCQLTPKSGVKALKKLMKKNNPLAFMVMAERYKEGDNVFQSDTKYLEMRICAAELGHAVAYADIGNCYEHGDVLNQNTSKALEFYEIAAKKGSVHAHEQLARFHGRNRNFHECIQHWKVAASAGLKEAMEALMVIYNNVNDNSNSNLLSKEELTKTLRAHQASNDDMKSEDRDIARAFHLTGQQSDDTS